MAKSAAERMAAYRHRHRLSGFTSVSLLVPKEDSAWFQHLAAERRQAKTKKAAALRGHWLRTMPPTTSTREPVPNRAAPASTPRSRADVLAAAILKLVVRSGWPVGASLGSELELMKQFSVSRTVLRQAIRLLTHHGVARMQRGVAGGLVVAAPDAARTARAVSIYLEYQRIAPRDILETRALLEQSTVALAVQRLSARGENRLREDIAAEARLDGMADAESLQRFHFTVAELSGDPALRLFTGIVLHLSDAHSNFSRHPRAERDKVVRRIKKLHAEIAAAMLARDTASACALMARYLDGYKDWME